MKQTEAEIFIYPLSDHHAARTESHAKTALSDSGVMLDDARRRDAQPSTTDLHISTAKMVNIVSCSVFR